MSAVAELHKIIDDKMCLGCGLCAALNPEQIEMGRGADGDLRPFAKDGFQDHHMARVRQTCPSLRVEGVPVERPNRHPIKISFGGLIMK